MSTQPEIEEWSSWDEEAPTSIKIEGGNGNVSPTNDLDEEPDYFKDMAPTIRKTQKVPTDGSAGPVLQSRIMYIDLASGHLLHVSLPLYCSLKF